MFDLPLPFSPVMALKTGSKPGTFTRVAYDLKPSRVISSIYMKLDDRWDSYRTVQSGTL